MKRCSLCDCTCEEPTHLDLFINGSEGIKVCLDCRMTLTEVARRIKIAANKGYMRAFKQLK
jgi:hypothetical protein